MQHINTWTLHNNVCDIPEKLIQSIDEFFDSSKSLQVNPTFLLDLTKNKYTFIEKYVYDIAMFHFARLNIHNTENHYVEFWFKTKVFNNAHVLHYDCDEVLKRQGKHQYPMLASVTYLNDFSNSPTIITNVDLDTYKYKKFEDQTEIVLSLPKRNKHITFQGKFFHGSTTLFDPQDTTSSARYIIAINLWDKKPMQDNDYCNEFDKHSIVDMNTVFERNPAIVSVQPDDTIGYVNVDNTVINYKLFEDMLYVKEYGTCYRFNDLIKKCHRDNDANITTFNFRLDNSVKETKTESELKSNVIHTFIISLKPEINRRLSIVNKLKYTNIKKYTIIDAVDGKTELDKYDFKVMHDWIDPLTKQKINVGEIGCFLSHYFIWKYIANHNIDVALILEDDCIFLDDFNTKFEQILKLDSTNYDYFALGREKLFDIYNLGPETVITNDYVIPKYSYNAHSYLLTNTGAKILANELALKYIIPVDEYITVMYNSFPFPKYSDYFKNMPKLRAIGLINDITDQDNDNTSSSIINQPIFEYTTK